MRGVLHDHVDVHPAIGEGAEQPGGDPRSVRYGDDGDLRLRCVVGDSRDDSLFHGRILLSDDGARLPGETGTDLQTHAVGGGELDGAKGEHARTAGGHLEHLFVRDDLETTCFRGDAGIGGEDAGHVGVDLALVGVERGGKRDGGGVGSTASERRHVAVRRHALEAGDDRNGTAGQSFTKAVGAHFEDLRPAMAGVGDDPGLRPGEARRPHTEVVDRHCQQRGGNALAGGEQHVHLAAVALGGDLALLRRLLGRQPRVREHGVGEPDEIVGGLAHGGDGDHHLIATPNRPCDVVGDGPDALGVGDGGPAELLHDESHGAKTLPGRRTRRDAIAHDHPVADDEGSIRPHVGSDLDAVIEGDHQPEAVTDELAVPDRSDSSRPRRTRII